MANCRQIAPVVQYDPDLNQAMLPYLPPSPDGREGGNQVVAVENVPQKHSQSGKSTRVLAVVQRHHDQIILTEDDKGKQMVVQRAHNVAKIQRRQRNENFKPSDLRLRGKQRPVAVGVVGSLDAALPEQALWRARQTMQNVQSERSDNHRPLQEEEERRVAEEARLRALAKNEKKMRSYRVDMGHLLENNATGQVSLCQNSGLNNEQLDDISGYEVLDEYQDDDIYDQINNASGFNDLPPDHDEDYTSDYPNLKAKQNRESLQVKYDCQNYTNNSSPSENNSSDEQENSSNEQENEGEENNDFLGDEQSLVEFKDEEKMSQPMLPLLQASSGALRREEAEERNRLRMLEIRQRQQSNMHQVINSTAQARELEAQRKTEAARQKALELNEKKMKSYRVTSGFTLGSTTNPDTNVQHANSSSAKKPNVAKSARSVQNASCTSIRQPSITKSTSSICSNSKAGSSDGDSLSKQEREKRRQEENRQKMLAAREKQQQNYARLLEQTAESRRLEEERKAEEARLKALEKNAKKMKSYKMTLGYSLEDYLQDSAPCIDSVGGEQTSSTAHAQNSFSSVGSASCTDNTEREQTSSTTHVQNSFSSVDSALCIDYSGREQTSSTAHAQNSFSSVVSASRVDYSENEEVTNAVINVESDVQSVVEDEEEELTEEQRNELFREQMRSARLKKQAELDNIIAKNKELQRR